ncbi:hypothetical protein EJB05_11604, partial [Eragrostis curvula]
MPKDRNMKHDYMMILRRCRVDRLEQDLGIDPSQNQRGGGTRKKGRGGKLTTTTTTKKKKKREREEKAAGAGRGRSHSLLRNQNRRLARRPRSRDPPPPPPPSRAQPGEAPRRHHLCSWNRGGEEGRERAPQPLRVMGKGITMKGDSAASMREEPSKKELAIQKRLDYLEEKIKGFKGWSHWSEADKQASREYRRAVLEAEYDRLGSLSDDEEVEEDEEEELAKYLKNWIWGRLYRLDETTIIPPIRFWDRSPPPEAKARTTIQVYSAKIVGLSGGLQFPLDVFGTIAARDSADRRRNIIFSRERNNCQTLTEQDPYLELTGPSRAILLLDPVSIEVMLYVKGSVQSEDRILNFQAFELIRIDTVLSRMINGPYTSKLSTLDLALGSVVSSVEGLVTIRLIDGATLPAEFLVTVYTINSKPSWRGSGDEDTDCKKILLLDSRRSPDAVHPSGHITLSRNVVSTRITGKLAICIETPVKDSKENKVLIELRFPARNKDKCHFWYPYGPGFIGLAVFWSLISYLPSY